MDKIIISHGDNDHIGGLNSVLKDFNTSQILTSVPEKIKQKTTKCNAEQRWVWDGVLFEVITTDNGFKGNNASCILKVSSASYSVLLSADIEKKAERYLVKRFKDKLDSSILISPHHSSNTSSTDEFLSATSPDLVIVSSGFQNRFNHPSRLVIGRYKNHNINVLNTNCSGQIDIYLKQKILISEYRKDYDRYYLR